jgi:hypothetical protein
VRIPLILGISGLLFVQTAGALSFPDFVQCVGASGHDPVCKLDAGIYPVSETISLGRSNITIEGTMLGSLLETTLQRAPGFDGALISDVNAIGTTLKSITIRDLTFDGNRAQNQSLITRTIQTSQSSCQEFARRELLLSLILPISGLALYGAGAGDVVVDQCYFGNPVVFGMWSDAIGDNSGITYRMRQHSVREQCDGEKSVFENAGESALLGEMTNLTIWGTCLPTTIPTRSLRRQRRPDRFDGLHKNALIWKNTFQDGSISPNGTTADGIELHGTYISVIDNTVKNNSGGGINMDGVQHILISNSDPRTGSFGNGRSGIEIAHSELHVQENRMDQRRFRNRDRERSVWHLERHQQHDSDRTRKPLDNREHLPER